MAACDQVTGVVLEQWMANARQARDNPSLENLAGLALASGIMVADFRMI